MKPSKYQENVLTWLREGTGNATCNAVAGSGKSTTLKLAALELQQQGFSPEEIKIIVFGKQNSLDLIAKFGRGWKQSIQTLHSVGFQVLQEEIGRFRRDERIVNSKYRKIAEDLDLIPTFRGEGSLWRRRAISKVEPFLNLVNLARLTLSDLSIKSIRHLVSHHNLEGINNYSAVMEAISQILLLGQEQAINDHRIDYTDMIWLPVEWALNQKCWFRHYKFVLTDECQDLNACQLELSLMLAGKSGRMLFVGDPRQAVFGFAGADNQSYQKIVKRTRAKELPLSLCYRCPASHIQLVNKLFPDIAIEAKEDAAPGTLQHLQEEDLWSEDESKSLRIGDMVLSRKTAPLVSLCIKLIGRGIPATVRGRDIGRQMKSELAEIAQLDGFEYQRFIEFAELYKKFKFQIYDQRDNGEKLKVILADKLEALTAIYISQPNAQTIEDIGNYIDSLFSDQESPITLSTCHRAKGLENERIFLIRPKDLPMTWEKQKEWQKVQEDNLLYVALTRRQSALYIVGEPDWFKKEEQAQASPKSKTQMVTKKSQPPSEDKLSQIWQLVSGLTLAEKTVLLKRITEAVNQEQGSRH